MLRNNEKQFVAEIIKNKTKPDNMSVSSLFKCLARYYYKQCEDMNVAEYARFLCEAIKEFNLSVVDYEEYNYFNFVKRICTRMRKGEMRRELVDVREVVITQKEFECIKKACGWQKQKILFTLYVLAKLDVKQGGWVNNSTREIFALANVGMSIENRDYALYELYSHNLIDLRRGVNRCGIHVNLCPEGEPAIIIRRFENLGNQYLANCKPGWTICKICGRMVKLSSDHDRSRKYCKKCAEIIKNHPKRFNNFTFY